MGEPGRRVKRTNIHVGGRKIMDERVTRDSCGVRRGGKEMSKIHKELCEFVKQFEDDKRPRPLK